MCSRLVKFRTQKRQVLRICIRVKLDFIMIMCRTFDIMLLHTVHHMVAATTHFISTIIKYLGSRF